MKIRDLSPGTLYTARLIYKLSVVNFGFEGPFRSSVSVGRRTSEREVFMDLDEQPRGRRDGWMELKLGEFSVRTGENGTVQFGLKETERLNWKRGLVIEGIEIRPVWMSSTDHDSGAEPLDESEAERLLPSDYEEILSRCVNPPNVSSKLDLYLQLCNSILTDERRKRFMLERSTGKKCYVLSARDLDITWGNDQRYWRWESAPENSRFSEVAKLLQVCWLNIAGRINICELTPDTEYGVYLIYSIQNGSFGLYGSQEASVAVGQIISQQRKVHLMRDHDGWLEVELGDFRVDDVSDENEIVQFELKEDSRFNSSPGLKEDKMLNWKSGLIIEGIEVKPTMEAKH
ncbi:hypothetical protein Taro_024471 [Colocasia esculenta]|uniref:Uncharacterized protein n=1 Tax=Colocasia esculenta TaxID=4460 RepID=A0A843V9G0_COLES|nr:hypothetical protein [Colocasia esculenta]